LDRHGLGSRRPVGHKASRHPLPPGIGRAPRPPRGALRLSPRRSEGPFPLRLLVLIALATLTVTSIAAAATFTATATLTGSSGFGLSLPANATLSTTLDGSDQIVTYAPLLGVSDGRGSGTGWNLSVASTTFDDGAGHTLDPGEIAGVTQSCHTGTA